MPFFYLNCDIQDVEKINLSTMETNVESRLNSVILNCNRKSDSLELVRFYKKTRGESWITKWDLSKPMDSWFGITLTNEGCVLTISLTQNNLTGSLIDLKLNYLELLYLPGNNLSGKLPSFKNIQKMTSIVLRDNFFEGPFPDIYSLKDLVVLNLLNNRLSGPLPILTNNKKMKELNWGHNNFKGYFPDNSVLHPLLVSNTFNGNKLTFEHVIQNLLKVKTHIELNGGTNSFVYEPQQKIYYETSITVNANTNYTIDLKIDDTVTTSTYTWYKNDVFYKTIEGSNKLSFTPIIPGDVGTYVVKITNPLAPQLTLESWPIHIVVGTKHQ